MDSDTFDAAFERLARAPVPAGLGSLEQAVLAQVAGERPVRQRDMFGFSVTAAAAALAMGIGGGLLPQGGDPAHASLTPLTGAAELAPSSLLVGQP